MATASAVHVNRFKRLWQADEGRVGLVIRGVSQSSSKYSEADTHSLDKGRASV